jgi:outer membrane protein OmpA-like peptidoglycan-associated protein
VRVLRYSYQMLKKAVSALALFLTLAQPIVHAQPRPMYVGGGLAVGLNLHELNLPVYRGDTLCGVFTSGTSVAPSGNLLFEMPLGDPAHSFWISPRLHLSSLGATITTSATDQAQARNPVDSSLVTVSQEYKLDATVLSLGADLFVKYPIIPGFFLMGGPSLNYLLQRNATLNEVITSPSFALYPNGTQTRSISTSQIVNSTSILAAFTLGASYDVPLSQKVMLAPELTFSAPINSIRTDYNWHVITIALGAELKFNIAPEPTMEVVPPIPPPPPAPPPVSKMTASVQISGVTTDSAGNEHEIPDPEIRVEEFERHEAYPALNYIFFDEDSSQIPSRYQLFNSSNDTNTFHIDSLSGKSTLDIYHDELNIIGNRLARNPSIAVTLTGTNSESTKEAKDTSIALRRAVSVQQYLENVWQIDSSRITVESEGIPTSPSSTATNDGSQENRRVEITSNDPSLLDPLSIETTDRTMNPPTIRLRTTESSAITLNENTLILKQGDRILASYRGPGPMQQWHPNPEDLPRTDSPLVATLDMTDSIGGTFEATDTTKVNLVTIRKKREERTQDKIIEHYNLITFNFDKSDLNDRSLRVVAEIATSVTPGTRIIIRGYTDISGESSHNLELSEARAKAVESALKQTLGDQAASVSFDTQGEGQNNLVDNRLPEGRFLSRTVFVELQKPVH